VLIGIFCGMASCQELSSAEPILRYEIMADQNTPDENDEWQAAPLASAPKDSSRSKRIGVPHHAALEAAPSDDISPPETSEPAEVIDTPEIGAPEPDFAGPSSELENPTDAGLNEAGMDLAETENKADRLEDLIRHALESPENRLP